MLLLSIVRGDSFLFLCLHAYTHVLTNIPLPRINKEAAHLLIIDFHIAQDPKEDVLSIFTRFILLAQQSEITIHLTMSKPIMTHCY